MGALSSKKKEVEWSWCGPPGRHSPYPVDYVAYPGPDLLYAFVDTLATYEIMRECPLLYYLYMYASLIFNLDKIYVTESRSQCSLIKPDMLE